MEWIDGIEKHLLQGWQFRCLNQNGESRLCGINDVHEADVPQVKHLKRQAVTMQLDSGELVSAQDYLAYWNWDIQVSDRHQVYAYQVENVRYLIPAFLLWRALIRPLKALLPFALMTRSLNSVCVRTENRSVGVVFWPGVLRARDESESDRVQMSWLHSFPSANTAWYSIFETASQGQIGFSAPQGTAKCIIKGEKVGNTFYITALTVTALATDETPFSHELNHPREMLFHQAKPALRADNTYYPNRLKSIELGRRGSGCLSDEEWLKIEPILLSSHNARRKYPLRMTADAVVQKLVSGEPWKKLQLESVSWNDAHQHYRRWLQSGKLQQIIEVLDPTKTDAVLI